MLGQTDLLADLFNVLPYMWFCLYCEGTAKWVIMPVTIVLGGEVMDWFCWSRSH